MKLRKLISVLTAVSIAATTLTLQESSVYAANTFATANDFISDVVTTALADITSATKDTAITTVLADVSTSGDSVTYKGTPIGYWDSADSATLWTDSSKTNKLIEESGEGYKVKPSLLATILSDINNDLVETYTPVSTDWSKIIGEYDVTLGDVTIPANNWIELTTSEEPLTDGSSFSISDRENIKESNLGKLSSGDDLVYFSWLVDSAGDLFIQEQLVGVYDGKDNMGQYGAFARYVSNTNSYQDKGYYGASSGLNTWDALAHGLYDTNYLSIGVTAPSASTLFAKLYMHNVTLSTMCTVNVEHDTTVSTLRKVTQPSVTYTDDIANASAYGVVYALTKDIGLQGKSISEVHTEHLAMFTSSPSAQKTKVGNAKLEKRITKLSGLTGSDVLTVSSTGWSLNGTSDFDTYFTTQQLTNAGDIVDITATADIEPLSFNVVVPTTLPIYIDANGRVNVADNAKVTNQSNAAIEITSIDIEAKAGCGWTLVASTPSEARDAKEFSFSTSLVADTVLAKNEELPFTYTPQLSPSTDGVDALDLASVLLTLDWADM